MGLRKIATFPSKSGKINETEGCRFQKLDSCVSMVEPAKDRMCNNISKSFDRTRVGRVLPERNVSSHVIIVSREFRKNSPKVIFVDHDQTISALAPDRPDQAFNMSRFARASGTRWADPECPSLGREL
jgi:hypothetical protein